MPSSIGMLSRSEGRSSSGRASMVSEGTWSLKGSVVPPSLGAGDKEA